jgi:hypothetical protein
MYNIYTTRIAITLLGNLEDTMGQGEKRGMNDLSLGLG